MCLQQYERHYSGWLYAAILKFRKMVGSVSEKVLGDPAETVVTSCHYTVSDPRDDNPF
jgi:hypothetical protein